MDLIEFIKLYIKLSDNAKIRFEATLKELKAQSDSLGKDSENQNIKP